MTPAIPDYLVEGSFTDAVAKDPREGPGAGDAGHVDHVALPGHQVRRDQLGEDEGRPGVDVHDLIVVRHAHRLHRAADQNTSAVDQHIEAAAATFEIFSQL